MSQQGLRQDSVRAETGTTGTYDEDWLALFAGAGFTTGMFDEKFLQWLNAWLSASHDSLPAAMAAFAAANNATNFGAVGTFSAAIVP